MNAKITSKTAVSRTIKNPKVRIFARNGKCGVDLFVSANGTNHYLVTQRSKGLLYLWLKDDGITLSELFRIKPSRDIREQKIFHYANRIQKIVSEFVEYELLA